MNRLSRVRNALYGQPWAITPEWLEAICEIFERHVAGGVEAKWEARITDDVKQTQLDESGYYLDGSVAVVPLMGPIFPRANLMTRVSGATSVEEFNAGFKAAIADSKANAVLIRADSPGGSVLGVFEAAASVFRSRQQPKRIIALAEGMCASAAYAIASQADSFYTTEASLVGSIGIVMRMDSMERKLLNEGVDSIILKTGKYKAIGNGPVTAEQRQALEAMMQDYFGRFKDAVMRARDGVDIEAVSTGEVWIGQKAIDMKLADGIASYDELVSMLSEK